MLEMLVVDDDLASLGTLCNMLRACGNKVDTAPSAEVAMRLMSKKKYDVIFLDYNMPTHNGVWFMRNASIPPDCAVILVTGFVDPSAMSDFRRLGIEVIVKKPFTLVGIRGCIDQVVAATQNKAKSDPPPPQPFDPQN